MTAGETASTHDIALVLRYWHAPMLHINDLTFRIEGRIIFDKASAGIPAGHKVGFVGRNGSGKTTLLRLIAGELHPDDGGIDAEPCDPHRLGALEAPGGPESLLEFVLAADNERASLLVEAETAHDPGRIADIHERLADIDAHAAPSRAARILAGLGFDEDAQQRPCAEYSGGWRMRVALAAMLFTQPDLLLLDEPTNYLDLEGDVWLRELPLARLSRHRALVSHDRDLLNRAVDSILHLAGQAHPLHPAASTVRGGPAREAAAPPQAARRNRTTSAAHPEAFIDCFGRKASKASAGPEPPQGPGAHAADRRADRGARRAVPVPKPLKAFRPLILPRGAAVGYVAGKPVVLQNPRPRGSTPTTPSGCSAPTQRQERHSRG